MPELDEYGMPVVDEEWTCSSCGAEDSEKNPVDRRYSFGVYAGRLCEGCCSKYRDRCGLDGAQGDPRDLDEYPDHYYEEEY